MHLFFLLFFSFSVSVDCPGSDDEVDPAVEGVTGVEGLNVITVLNVIKS